MPKGFFASSLVMKKKAPSTIPRCGACGLLKVCATPKMPVQGEGRKGILLVGSYPSKFDDETGRMFSGDSGRLLQTTLKEFDVSMRKDCWLTNALICHPTETAVKKKHVDYCRPNLTKTIQDLQPHLIIPLGWEALAAVIGGFWKEDLGKEYYRWFGWQIPSQHPNVWVCPTWHPAFLVRGKDDRKGDDLGARIWRGHIEAALTKTSRPWDEVPNYEAEVECIVETSKAARIIRDMSRRGGLVAIDYETNMLKPDSKQAEIVCCSVCWQGKRTIAYPWHGDAIEATKELWENPDVHKIASNLMFEDRWSRCQGFRVRGWKWDTMNAAHVLDNRPEVSGLKFQSYVRLGAESYDDHIKPLLRSRRGESVNRITTEVDLQQLLLYCGLDTLLEYKVAKHQAQEMGVPFVEAGRPAESKHKHWPKADFRLGGIAAYHGDCLKIMPRFGDGDFDAIIVDLPYGVTHNQWDHILDPDVLWPLYWRLLKPHGVVLLHAMQPFSSMLVMSQPKYFKYVWYWDKGTLRTGFLNAGKQPLRKMEEVLVFYKKQPVFNPQLGKGVPYKTKGRGPEAARNYGHQYGVKAKHNDGSRQPDNLLFFDGRIKRRDKHPTEKPVGLMEYLIRTYTDPGDVILDHCAGGATTGVAAVRTDRQCVMIEQDDDYFPGIVRRITKAVPAWEGRKMMAEA